MPQIAQDKYWLQQFYRVSLLSLICMFLTACLGRGSIFFMGFNCSYDSALCLESLPSSLFDYSKVLYGAHSISSFFLGIFMLLLLPPLFKNRLTRHIFKRPVGIILTLYFSSVIIRYRSIFFQNPDPMLFLLQQILSLIILGFLFFIVYKSYLLSHPDRQLFLTPPLSFPLKLSFILLLLFALVSTVHSYFINAFQAYTSCRESFFYCQGSRLYSGFSFTEFLLISYRYLSFAFLMGALAVQVMARKKTLRSLPYWLLKFLPTLLALKIILGVAQMVLDEVQTLVWFDYILGSLIYAMCFFLAMTSVILILPLKSSLSAMQVESSKKRAYNTSH